MKPYRFEAEGEVWRDGELRPAAEVTVALTDPAVQSGIGVFETLAVREGVALDIPEHFARLEHGASRLDVALRERGELSNAVRVVAAAVEGGHGWLKILAMRGGASIVFAGRMDPAEEGRQVSAVLLPFRQSPFDPLAGLKTTNYAGRILALAEAHRRGADEGIWLNHRGHLAEGCTSSLFVIRGRSLFTPSLADGILPGVVRSIVLHVASRTGIVVHEGKVRLEKLERADEAFLTSSLRAVRPLVVFERQPVGRGVPGAMTLRISEQVQSIRMRASRVTQAPMEEA